MRKVMRVTAVALALWSLLLVATRPVAAQWENRQLVFGPLMLALNAAYSQWLAGPLGGHAPRAASFTATLDATKDPYSIAFSAVKGYSIRGGSFSIPSSAVIDPSSRSVPFYTVSKGPITLSGTYVLAYLAAHKEHAKLKAHGTGFAFESSPGTAVIIMTPAHKNDVVVVFTQTPEPIPVPTGYRIIGCDREQFYFVDPSTFTLTKTMVICAG